MQDCSNSIAKALELLQSRTKPSKSLYKEKVEKEKSTEDKQDEGGQGGCNKMADSLKKHFL